MSLYQKTARNCGLFFYFERSQRSLFQGIQGTTEHRGHMSGNIHSLFIENSSKALIDKLSGLFAHFTALPENQV